MVTAPAAAVAATDNYVITAEAMQLDFSAKIRDQGGFELGAENPFTDRNLLFSGAAAKVGV